jgi:hypothetical protein
VQADNDLPAWWVVRTDIDQTKRARQQEAPMNKNDCQQSRRDFLKKTAYTAPVILTMAAAPAFAKNGSHQAFTGGNNGIGQEKRGIIDGPPPGLASKPNLDFNDNGSFAPLGHSGAQAGGRPK